MQSQYTNIKIKKQNVRKLRIDDQNLPGKITEKASSMPTTNNQVSATVVVQQTTTQQTQQTSQQQNAQKQESTSKLSMQNMPALDQNLPQSLRGLANNTNMMRHSQQQFQPLSSFEGTQNRQSMYLKSLKAETSDALSPVGIGKTFASGSGGAGGAARYNEYVTSGHIKSVQNTHKKMANDSIERPNPHHSQKLNVGQLRLKPSQIVQEAKNDVQFGNNRQNLGEIAREGSSLAVLCGYLQSSQSQPAFQPLRKKSMTKDQEQTESSRQQEKIAAVINERFVYKENSRFKKNRDTSNSKMYKNLEETGNMSQSKMETIKSSGKKNMEASPKRQKQSSMANFQSITSEQAQAGGKVFTKYQQHLQTPMPSNFQVMPSKLHNQLGQLQLSGSKQQRSSIQGNRNSLFNAHQSVQSNSKQQLSPSDYRQPLSGGLQPHKIQTMSKETDHPVTYVPFLKQTPLGSQSQHGLQEDIKYGQQKLRAYPSQKVFAPGSIAQSQPHQREEKNLGGLKKGKKHSPSPSEKAKQEYMPYQVQLMSLANLNANNYDETSRLSSHMTSVQQQQNQMPNKVKLKQERIIQRLERKQKKDQANIIVAPQGNGSVNVVKKTRNADKMRNTDGKSSAQNTRPGSTDALENYRSRQNSQDSARGKTSADRQALGDLPDPVDQVKLLPLKARLIFKKAMKELDSVDLVNSSQLPMSRPRIRAILKKMKDNLEQGTFPDERSPSKNRADANPLNNNQLLQGLGKQAERDLFGMLIREKKQKKLNLEKNEEMRQLYDERMRRKKAEFLQKMEKNEQRQKIKDNNGYLSASSSEDFADSFEFETRRRGNNTAQKSGANAVKSERQQNDYVTTLLSSERPSSAEQIFGSVTSRKDVDRYNRMRSLSTQRQKKQERMVLEELLALCIKPELNDNKAAGNFYSKFQNLDKIIQKEDNEVACTTIQEQFEKRELEEEQRMLKIVENHQRGNSTLISPMQNTSNIFQNQTVTKSFILQMTTSNYHTNDELNQQRLPRSGKSSFMSTPGKTLPQKRQEVNKSPIIEYLKQAQKDNLLPHFMPFKKLQEATNMPAFNGTNGIKYCLDQFSISTRIAPSIASAVMNLQQLQSMSLIDTMLNEESFMTILQATPKTLVSLNLSQNEHLTTKCFRELHSMKNLAHLSLEKCNIRDDAIAVLMDLDPHKLNVPIEPIPPVPAMKKSKTSLMKKSLSVVLGASQAGDEDTTPPFIPSGLIKTLKLFNVSKNQVSDAGAKDISNFIDKSECLETLQLHWNKIRAKGSMFLAKSIKANRTIKILDISFNSFGSGAIKKAILQDDPKKEDEVQAEQRHPIKQIECAVSAWKWRKTLMKNFTLLHLDISFNAFTDHDMIALGDGLRENHTLLGCHVEGNNCKLDSLGFIVPILTQKPANGQKLRQRGGREVYDVHNYDRIPITMENMHLESTDERSRPSKQLDEHNIIRSGELAPLLSPSFSSKLQPRNCWLCEGWSEQLFEVRLPDKFIGCEVASVYLHLGYEDFKPMVMQEKIEEPAPASDSQQQESSNANNNGNQGGRKTGGRSRSKANTPKRKNGANNGLTTVQEGESRPKPQAQTFQLFRMVPPSKEGIQYYYSLQNPKNFRKETFIDPYKKKVFVEDEQRQQYCPKGKGADSSDSEDQDQGQDAVLAFPKFVNQTKTIQKKTMSLTPQARMQLKAKPRCAFNTQELSRPKSPWSIPKSFFAKYKHDNDLIIGKCFDWDWRCSTLEKMIKDPHEKESIMKFLRPKYGLIRETYKHLACVAPSGNMPSLGMNILTELMLKCNEFVDYKNTKLSDVDLAFIATNAAGAKNFPFRAEICINPERQIIRYQFFEILMRLAIERFTQKQKMSSLNEGIKVFYEQYIQDTFMKYSSHPWRLDRYWNEDCDNVIKENMEVLKDIYNGFAQALSPGDPKIIRLSNFIDLVTQSGACDDNFGAREIGPLFNLAFQTQMDEINKTRHMDMQFIEFVEALARIAEKTVSHNFQDFPVERAKTGANTSFAKTQKQSKRTTMNVKLSSAMESVSDNRDPSQNNKSTITASPGPSPGRGRDKGRQEQQVQDETSALVIFREKSRSPSYLREGRIEPEPIKNERVESAEILQKQRNPERIKSKTPKRDQTNQNASFNLDIQADLSIVQAKDESAAVANDNNGLALNNISMITADQAEDQKESSFLSGQKNKPDKSGVTSVFNQSIAKKLNRSTSKPSIGPRYGRQATNRSNGSGPRSGASRSKSRGYGSDFDQSSMNGASAFEGEMQLSEKLQKYINRIAVTCLGQSYATKYLREWNRRNARNARNKFIADADLLAQAELLGQIGFKATLIKMRYSDQKAPAQPENDKKNANKPRTSMKITK